MRIVTHLKSFYDWEPVPSDVQVTEEDIKAGKVKPSARKDGYLMRVRKNMPSGEHTHNTTVLSEEMIIRRIVHEMMPQQGCVAHTRMEAVGQILARHVMPEHAHPKFIKDFEVEDTGPDEKLFDEIVTPYTTALHASGHPLIDPEDVPMLKEKYLEPTQDGHHVDHLRAKFNLKKAAAK